MFMNDKPLHFFLLLLFPWSQISFVFFNFHKDVWSSSQTDLWHNFLVCILFSLVGDVSLLLVSLQCVCVSSMLVSIMEWWKFSWTSCLQHKSTRINWGSTGITGTFVKLLWILCHCTLPGWCDSASGQVEIILASWSHVLIWQFNHYSSSGDQSWSSVCPRSFILNPVSLSVCFLQK